MSSQLFEIRFLRRIKVNLEIVKESSLYFLSPSILKEKIKEYKPDILISDPVYKNLVNEELTFIPLLHYGYSTRLYLDLDYEYCGKKAYEYFKKFI